MCVIISLANGQALPEDKLKHAVLNNPHGFGIISVHDGKLEVFHKFDERGNNPEVVARELEKRKDADWNHLHVRYCTRGEKSKENTHPFTVFKNKERRVEFMHNGSLNNKFANMTWTGTGPNPKSDSRIFAERYITPMLQHYVGENGPADIEDVFLEGLLEDFFSYTNRGLLVANDLDPMYLGKWDTTLGVDGEKIVVSNTDYFFNSQSHRMTEFYKPKMSDLPRFLTNGPKNTQSVASETLEEEEVGDQSHYPLGTAGTVPVKTGPVPTEENIVQLMTTSTTKPTGSTEEKPDHSSTVKLEKRGGRKITPLKEVDLRKTGRFLQASDIDGLLDVVTGELDDELITYVSMLSLLEFRNYVELNPDGAARLLEHIFLRATALIKENDELEDKHLRATSRIANLVSSAKQQGVSFDSAA